MKRKDEIICGGLSFSELVRFHIKEVRMAKGTLYEEITLHRGTYFITIVPDHGFPYAHIYDSRGPDRNPNSERLIGKFRITNITPKRKSDIVTLGKCVIPSEVKRFIVKWANTESERFKGSNWAHAIDVWNNENPTLKIGSLDGKPVNKNPSEYKKGR